MPGHGGNRRYFTQDIATTDELQALLRTKMNDMMEESENVWADLEVCPDKAEFKALRCQIKTLRELLTQQESVVKTLQGQVEAEKAKTADVQHRQAEVEQLMGTQSAQLQSLQRRCAEATEEREALRSQVEALSNQVEALVTERDHSGEPNSALSTGVINDICNSKDYTINQLRAEVQYLRSWAPRFRAPWMPAPGPLMPAPPPFRPPVYGPYPNPLARTWGPAPMSPVAPAGMAAPAGPFQPMHPGGPLQHPMAAGPFQPMHSGGPLQHPMAAGPFQPMHPSGPLQHPMAAGPFHPMHPGAPLQHPMGAPPQQAVQDEDFAADEYHLDAEYALQQQADDFQFAPQNEYFNPQEVQGCQHPVDNQWLPVEHTVPTSEFYLQSEEHFTAPEAYFRQTQAEQCKQMPTIEEELTDADPGLNKMDEQGSTTAAADNSFTSRPEGAEGTSTPTATSEPLKSPAAVPAATKLQDHTGDSPAQPLPGPSAVQAPAAAPAAMAAPGTQPAALPAAFVATSGATHGDELSTAAEHPMQHSPSLCTDPEGSGGAQSEPPATSEEEAPVSDQHGPSAEPAAAVRLQLKGSPADGALDTAVPEAEAALSAPEPSSAKPVTADTAQEREVLPMSNRDAEPAVSKPVGALPAASIERSAVARPHWTYATAAAQLPPPPPVLPLRPRPEAASQGRAPGTGSQQRALGPTTVRLQSDSTKTQGQSQGASGQKPPVGQRRPVRQQGRDNMQGSRSGNGARRQPQAAQSQGRFLRGPSKGGSLEVQRPSTHQTDTGASQAQQSRRRKGASQPERGESAVLVVQRTPNRHLKRQSQG